MSSIGNSRTPDAAELVATADETAFNELARRHRRELHVHCYRMLASLDDAEDLVQETFLRAWQKRATYQGRASFRSWLYRIATNACIDFLRRKGRSVTEIGVRGTSATTPHVAWLQPYPDRLLEAPAGNDADAPVVRRETIELAFIVALQLLPPRQRAVLLLRDVLDWSASETAALLESTVPAVNGALQRARATLRDRRPTHERAAVLRSESDDQDRQLVQQYVDATERNDAHTLTELLRDDALFTMPPEPLAWAGRDTVVQAWVEGGFGTPPFDDFRCIITAANGSPAVVNYLRKPGETVHRVFAMDVLRIEDGAIAEITAFDVAELIDAFGLPATLE